MRVKKLLIGLLLLGFYHSTPAQLKILFDASKAEAAGNADWVIDADLHNLGFGVSGATLNGGSESNAQRTPTPAQAAAAVSMSETSWDGGLSFWAVDCAYKGYTVESLPYNGRITWQDASNPQDLSNYKVFVVCEPNILFTDAEKMALLNFVSNGGGLFMISDHNVSDRNSDGWDSPHIWNDLIQNNQTGDRDPFGITFDYVSINETSLKLAALPASDSILHGSWGNVTRVQWSAGTTITIDPAANTTVKAVIYRTSVTNATGNTGVMVAYARYGAGKVVAIGDSSPCDDGTGDNNDALYTGYNGDVTPNHRNLLMNATIWLASRDKLTYTFNGDGNWSNSSNWLGGKLPPLTLPAGDSIVIDPVVNGNCVLDVSQHISAGATLRINTGKNLLVPGTLTIQ